MNYLKPQERGNAACLHTSTYLQILYNIQNNTQDLWKTSNTDRKLHQTKI